MQGYEITDQTQSDASSGSFFHAFMLRLVETVEDMLLILITDSDTGIGHLDFQKFLRICQMLQTHGDTTSLRSILESIRQQVHNHFTYLVGIKSHRKTVHYREEGEPNLFPVGHQHERIAYSMDIADNITFRQRQTMPIHLPLSEIQQLVDQHQQTLGIPIHQQQAFAFGSVLSFFEYLFQRRDNQCQRCP